MSCSVLHHVEMCVKEENNLLRLLTHGFGFHVFGRRVTPCASTWALRSGTSVFTVIKRNRLVGCGRYQSYGFAAENNAEDKVSSDIELPTAAPICTHIDHVTYVCEAGEIVFPYLTFSLNSEETEEAGFVLGGNIGLRIKALEYWRCAEKGLAAPNASINDSSLKVVIGEPLPD
ncbi:putative 4-hydroxyphenylpyruvate dioxygenase-like 3, partial [Homarus americanus]